MVADLEAADLTMAELKAAGNAAFKARDYEKAVIHYTDAIKAAGADSSSAADDSEVAKLLANRSMARLKLADAAGAKAESPSSVLVLALEDAQAGTKADPQYAKAHFREAQCCLKLGRADEALAALQRTWLCAPGDPEVHKLLLAQDIGYAKFHDALARLDTSTATKRENLTMMVSRGHPRSLRTQYYAVWMKHWEPKDRESALCEAFTHIIDQFKQDLKGEAKNRAVAEKEHGKVSFGEDGFGVMRRVQEHDAKLQDEGFALVSIVLEDLITENSYDNPEIFCQHVEAVGEGREEEPRFLTPSKLERMAALRPELLMGEVIGTTRPKPHPLREWMIPKMALNLRKQVLIGCCIRVIMSAAGLVGCQVEAINKMRNMRREANGLVPLAPGEESEDDEIMCRNDYEEYKQRQVPSAGDAKRLLSGSAGEAPIAANVPALEAGSLV